jgi:hypothetical protein
MKSDFLNIFAVSAVGGRFVVNVESGWKVGGEAELGEHDEEAEDSFNGKDGGDGFGVAAGEGDAGLGVSHAKRRLYRPT